MVMPEPDIPYVYLPIPEHRGILVSPLISRSYSISELKEILLQINLRKGFERWRGIELQLIRKDEWDSVWLTRWKRDGRIKYAVISGQEL